MKNIKRHIIRNCLAAAAFLLPLALNAQVERKYIRQGNREYNKEKYEESEVSYRRAEEENNRMPEISFNIGDALYKQGKYEESAKQFANNVAKTEDKDKKAAGLYNLGNSLLQAGKLEESIASYKESLKLKPNNPEAKYNLAYAQNLLKEQEQEQQQQDQNNNQDNNQNQDENQNQQNQDNQDQNNENQNQNQQQDEQSISKEDAERLLNSLANDERKVQEKVNLEKAANERRSTVKNW